MHVLKFHLIPCRFEYCEYSSTYHFLLHFCVASTLIILILYIYAKHNIHEYRCSTFLQQISVLLMNIGHSKFSKFDDMLHDYDHPFV